MKNRKNLLKIITCAFFVSGYSQVEKIIKSSTNIQEQQNPQHNKLTSVFK